MNFRYDKTDNVKYECIYRTILDGNFMNMYLIITKQSYCAIDADHNSFHLYYIIRFSSSTYIYNSSRLE